MVKFFNETKESMKVHYDKYNVDATHMTVLFFAVYLIALSLDFAFMLTEGIMQGTFLSILFPFIFLACLIPGTLILVALASLGACLWEAILLSIFRNKEKVVSIVSAYISYSIFLLLWIGCHIFLLFVA